MTAMYETFYGFSQPPFGLTPDIRFCYQHRSYTRAKAYMEYAVMRGEGFLVVTGRPGMGKTTLIQDLLGDLGSEQRLVARIDSTQLDADDLLRLVAYAFGLPARGLDKATLLHNLGDFLRRRPAGAGTAILIVDEAQNLPDRSLEELRLITNLQQGASALIQIFLIGQESLRDVIRQRNLEQLQQRVVAACHLEPLDIQETRAYVRHRLLCADWSGDPSFEAEALGLIYRASAGVPRVINKVCDRLLLYGSVDELHSIRGADARLVIQEFEGEFLETAGFDGRGAEPSRQEGPPGAEIEDLRWAPEDGGGAPLRGVPVSRPGEAPAAEDQGHPLAGPRGGAVGIHTDTEAFSGGAAGLASDPEHPWVSSDSVHLDLGIEHLHPGLVSEAEPVARPSGGQDPVGAASPPHAAEAVTKVAPVAPQSGPRRRYRAWPFATAAALLLGLGGLAWAIHGRAPDTYLAQASRWTEGALSVLRSLSSELGASLQGALRDPGLVPENRVMAIPDGTRSDQEPFDPDDATSDPRGGLIALEPAEQVEASPAINAPVGFLSSPLATVQPNEAPWGHPGPNDAATGPRSAEPVPNQTVPMELKEGAPAEADSSLPAGAADSTVSMDPGSDPAGPSPGAGSPEAWVADTQWMGPVMMMTARAAESSPPDGTPEGLSAQGAEPSLDASQAALTPAVDVHASVAAVGAPLVGQGQTPPRTLKEDLRALGLRVRDQGEGVLTFDLAQEVPFEFGSARLPDQAQAVLGPLAQALIRNPTLAVTLVGHTDDAGPADYNRRLSLARARAVEASLKRLGVADSRLASRGMGKDAPLPEESDPAAARHRRVEVVIGPVAP